MTGAVDDLRIYDAALSADEVREVMAGGDPTSVDNVPATAVREAGNVYNLGGQQVTDGTLPKGVYVKNGVKVMVND